MIRQYLATQYQQAQQNYIQTKGETYKFIGVLYHYKDQFKLAEQRVIAQTQLYEDNLKKMEEEISKTTPKGATMATITKTHLMSISKVTKEWSQLQMELSITLPDAVEMLNMYEHLLLRLDNWSGDSAPRDPRRLQCYSCASRYTRGLNILIDHYYELGVGLATQELKGDFNAMVCARGHIGD
eukprot:Gb_06695 [translate_table: standard]